MRNYKHYKLYLRNPKRRWLNTSVEVFTKLIDKLKADDNFMTRASLINPIIMETMVWYKPEKMNHRYALIIKGIIEHFECRGVWVKSLINTEPYTSVEIWGYPEDVEICTNVLGYYVNGIMMVEENLTAEYRRIKLNGRRTGKSRDYSTRVLVNNIIDSYIKDIILLINYTPKLNSPDRELKLDLIFREIINLRKLDVKHFKMNYITKGAVTARKGVIQFKRLV